MEQLPNIVRQRLLSAKQTEHPDSGMLNAFAEQALSERERNSVLEHLSACLPCREVLSLAQADVESASNIASVTRRRTWWIGWPVLRWGSLAACIVVVAAAVLVNREHKAGSSVARVTELSAPQPVREMAKAAPAPTAPALPSSQASGGVPALSNSRIPAKSVGRHEPAPVALANKATANQPAVPGPAENAVQNSATTTQAETVVASGQMLFGAKTQPPPAAVAAQTVNGVVRDEEKTALNEKRMTAKDDSVPRADSLETAGSAARKQKLELAPRLSRESSEGGYLRSAVAPGAQDKLDSNALVDTAATTNGASIMKELIKTKWTLSSEGLPQRSLDSGKTWEKVHVDRDATFRALSQAGLGVWVGGLRGLLYHSSDVGMHWMRVSPVCEGTTLTADIVRVDFVDGQHGKVTTANQETWATSDGGKTWQR